MSAFIHNVSIFSSHVEIILPRHVRGDNDIMRDYSHAMILQIFPENVVIIGYDNDDDDYELLEISRNDPSSRVELIECDLDPDDYISFFLIVDDLYHSISFHITSEAFNHSILTQSQYDNLTR